LERKIVMSRIQHCFLVSCDEVQRDFERHVQSAMLLLLVTSLTYKIVAGCGVIHTHSMIQVNLKTRKYKISSRENKIFSSAEVHGLCNEV
jgi:hypothetical protein